MSPEGANLKRTSWLREVGVYLLLYGVPLIVLFPWTGWRPSADFVANLKTKAVSFTIGHYGGAGFAGDRADVSFEGFDHAEFPERASCAPPDGEIRFRNVKFQSLPLPDGTKLRVEWYPQAPTGARMVARYGDTPPEAVVFLDDQSSASARSCIVGGKGALLGNAQIYPKPGEPLIVNVVPVSSDPKEAVELAFDQSKKLFLGNRGLNFRLPDQSAITGSDGYLEILNADRKEPLRPEQELRIDALAGGTYVPDLRITKTGIAITIDGSASVLSLDGRDVRPSPAEYLRAQKILSAWLTTAILVGSAGLTIASRIKLVKLGGEGK
jgi:hypothetical protein